MDIRVVSVVHQKKLFAIRIEKKEKLAKAQLYGQECLIEVTTLEVGGSSGRHFFMSFINVPSLLLFVSRLDC